MNPQTGQAAHQRYGYLEQSKVTVSRKNENMVFRTVPGAQARQHFEIPQETATCAALGQQPWQRPYPMILDSFGGPILYFRADSAGLQAVDNTPDDPQAQGTGRGVYHFRDNSDLLNETAHLVRLNARGEHNPLDIEGTTFPYPPNNVFQVPAAFATLGRDHRFAAYVRNKNANSSVAPQKKDSYLLISAGEDGIFGTADDIANFDHNGAELQHP
jgi:hypothetical protein